MKLCIHLAYRKCMYLLFSIFSFCENLSLISTTGSCKGEFQWWREKTHVPQWYNYMYLSKYFTVSSFLELISYLFSIEGVSNLLSEKLNQDLNAKKAGAMKTPRSLNLLRIPKVSGLSIQFGWKTLRAIAVGVRGNITTWNQWTCSINRPLTKRKRHGSL